MRRSLFFANKLSLQLEGERKEIAGMMEVICFHNQEEINGYLSNWFLADFCVWDIRFSSMEQYMML